MGPLQGTLSGATPEPTPAPALPRMVTSSPQAPALVPTLPPLMWLLHRARTMWTRTLLLSRWDYMSLWTTWHFNSLASKVEKISWWENCAENVFSLFMFPVSGPDQPAAGWVHLSFNFFQFKISQFLLWILVCSPPHLNHNWILDLNGETK